MNGGHATPAPSGQWQKCHFQLRMMPPTTGKYPQVKVFTVHHLWIGISRHFSYETATKNPTDKNVAGVQSLYTPKASRKRSSKQGPVGPHKCAAPWSVMPGAGVVHTPWWGKPSGDSQTEDEEVRNDGPQHRIQPPPTPRPERRRRPPGARPDRRIGPAGTTSRGRRPGRRRREQEI